MQLNIDIERATTTEQQIILRALSKMEKVIPGNNLNGLVNDPVIELTIKKRDAETVSVQVLLKYTLDEDVLVPDDDWMPGADRDWTPSA